MKISEIVATPLWIPYEQPFHWSQGVTHGAEVILVEVHTPPEGDDQATAIPEPQQQP